MSRTATASPFFQVALGPTLSEVGLPLLAGDAVETLFPAVRPAGQVGEFALYEGEDRLLGLAQVRVEDDVEAAARRLYIALFQAIGDHALTRVWNYVPQINAPGPGGLENYRAFCRGRSVVFDGQFGGVSKQRMPAASGVGTDGDSLVVVFAASRGQPRHFENPRQVAAYDYPVEHGPRSPSFARATVVPGAHGRDVFISGTAAIRGHQSVAPGDLAGQVQCTVENLRAIGAACGAGEDLGANRAAVRHLKVYLRKASDLSVVATALGQGLVGPGDRVSYLRSDICRAELDVEIEVTLLG